MDLGWNAEMRLFKEDSDKAKRMGMYFGKKRCYFNLICEMRVREEFIQEKMRNLYIFLEM